MAETKALRRLRRKLTLENLWLYIIKALMASKAPLRAYDVKVMLRKMFNIKPATVTVYTVIYRMVNEGLLEGLRVNGETKYRVTDKGVKAFNEALEFLRNILNVLEKQ